MCVHKRHISGVSGVGAKFDPNPAHSSFKFSFCCLFFFFNLIYFLFFGWKVYEVDTLSASLGSECTL